MVGGVFDAVSQQKFRYTPYTVRESWSHPSASAFWRASCAPSATRPGWRFPRSFWVRSHDCTAHFVHVTACKTDRVHPYCRQSGPVVLGNGLESALPSVVSTPALPSWRTVPLKPKPVNYSKPPEMFLNVATGRVLSSIERPVSSISTSGL